MKTAADISLRSIALLLCLTLVLAPVGCTASEIQASVDTSAQVADVWAGFLMPINPVLGGGFATAAQALRDAGKGYADYLKAETSLKGQQAAELRAALQAIQSNLALYLNDARIHNQELLEYVTAAVAVINTTVILILAKLPAPPGISRADAVRSSLPTVPSAKNAGDLKSYWNAHSPAGAQVK